MADTARSRADATMLRSVGSPAAGQFDRAADATEGQARRYAAQNPNAKLEVAIQILINKKFLPANPDRMPLSH